MYDRYGEFVGVIFSSPTSSGNIPLYESNDFWPKVLDTTIRSHARLLAEGQVVFDFAINGKLTKPPSWDFDKQGEIILPGPKAQPIWMVSCFEETNEPSDKGLLLN